MDTVTSYSTRMEQRLSGDPWDCLFGSDSITDAIQYRPEMFHMDIRCCDNTASSLDCLGLGFGFNSEFLSEIEEDPVSFSCEKSLSSASNLEDLNLDSDSELALTLDPNLILPHNGPIRSPTPGSEVPMLSATTRRRGIVGRHEDDETENESEPERTENDEEDSDEDEEEEEEEEEEDEEEEEEEESENEHNETEYETAEDVTEEEEDEEEDEGEEEAEDEEDEEDEDLAGVRRPPPGLETPTSIPSSSALAASSPTMQLTRVQMQQHPKLGTMKVHDIKMLAAAAANSSATGQTASHHIRKQIYNNNLHDIGATGALTTVMIQAKREKDTLAAATGHIENPYPKPAYSYSCLIAMALKNSRTGSLPVSEIYNFMCRHFPYFKTAPNGWKNSVRHNLSLNKCFEKIEKPPGSGSQRKGCLWAIHPSKVAKMDEEVRKWSRKDPVAIKRAMVCPEQLELLERGEMKYETTGDGHEEMYEDAESYASSENDDTGADEADETIAVVNGVDEETTTTTTTTTAAAARLASHSVDDETSRHIDVVDDDIVVEELYDDVDIEAAATAAADVLDTRLLSDVGFAKHHRERSFLYEFVSCQKRPKTLAGLQNDYVYRQIDAPAPTRRKSHHVAQPRPGTPESGNP